MRFTFSHFFNMTVLFFVAYRFKIRTFYLCDERVKSRSLFFSL